MELIEKFLTKEEYTEVLNAVDAYPEMGIKHVDSEYSTYYHRIVRVEIDKHVFAARDSDPRSIKVQVEEFFGYQNELFDVRETLVDGQLPKTVWWEPGPHQFPVEMATETYLVQKRNVLRKQGHHLVTVSAVSAALKVVLNHLGNPLPKTCVPYVALVAEDIVPDPSRNKPVEVSEILTKGVHVK